MTDTIDAAVKQVVGAKPSPSQTATIGEAPREPAIEQRAPRLCVGVPSSDMLHAEFAIALSGLIAFTIQHGVHPMIANPRTSYIYAGRNMCVDAAIEHKADYLLFLDSDMVFPPQTALRLMSHRKDIVGGTYVKRVDPHPILGSPYEGGQLAQTTGLQRMAELPTGCMLIDMKVFDKFKPPYFWHKPHPSGGLYGEDILFCHEAMERGFEIWADMDLSMKLGHIGNKTFTIPDTYLKATPVRAFDLTGPALPKEAA